MNVSEIMEYRAYLERVLHDAEVARKSFTDSGNRRMELFYEGKITGLKCALESMPMEYE